jgi:hypothetical protein
MKIKGFYGDTYDVNSYQKIASIEILKSDGRKFYIPIVDITKVIEGVKLLASKDEADRSLEHFKKINQIES